MRVIGLILALSAVRLIAGTSESFEKTVQPVLATTCAPCRTTHNSVRAV